jgi:AcrR family transcriptional regulator
VRTRAKTGSGVRPTQLPGERPGPIGGKRDQNRRARTQGLLEAAQKLFLERGIESVSIDDITREASVAKGSFYRYFHDKEDLVRAAFVPARERVLGAFQRAERKLNEAEGADAVRRVYMRLGRELAAALMNEPDVTRLYLQESRAPAVHARVPVRELEREIAAAALRLSELAFSHGLLRRAHPQVSTLAVIGATERMLHAFFSGDLELEPTAAIKGIVSIVLDGMRED